MRMWTLRHWLAALGVALVAGVAIGVPTGVISTPLYTRMTPVLWWNYPVWAVTSVLEGLLIATYVRHRTPAPSTAGDADPAPAPPAPAPRSVRALAAGLLSAFAVGCPVCNKLVVLALGVSGALSYWAPIQPVLGVASVGLLAYALVRRLRAAESCPVPAPAADYDGVPPSARPAPAGDERSERATAG
ncbi:hypothetical protein AB0M28_38730 [Streptomyces sp. NPDC051940]|uniref:hypothetical protein n=1 Tax=Streptomyces sp. NPDC051940 TaxID=3155675 RepID=UPI003414C743